MPVMASGDGHLPGDSNSGVRPWVDGCTDGQTDGRMGGRVVISSTKSRQIGKYGSERRAMASAPIIPRLKKKHGR